MRIRWKVGASARPFGRGEAGAGDVGVHVCVPERRAVAIAIQIEHYNGGWLPPGPRRREGEDTPCAQPSPRRTVAALSRPVRAQFQLDFANYGPALGVAPSTDQPAFVIGEPFAGELLVAGEKLPGPVLALDSYGPAVICALVGEWIHGRIREQEAVRQRPEPGSVARSIPPEPHYVPSLEGRAAVPGASQRLSARSVRHQRGFGRAEPVPHAHGQLVPSGAPRDRRGRRREDDGRRDQPSGSRAHSAIVPRLRKRPRGRRRPVACAGWRLRI